MSFCLKAEEAKVKILEVTGDRVDNKSKLEVIRQEEEIIRREKEERKKEEEAEKLAKAKVLAAETAAEVAVLASHSSCLIFGLSKCYLKFGSFILLVGLGQQSTAAAISEGLFEDL